MLRFIFFLILVYLFFIMLRKPLGRLLGMFIAPGRNDSPNKQHSNEKKKSPGDELLDSDTEYVDYEDIPKKKKQ